MPSERNLDRKLAAILFADIVGYTALMQEDEAVALNKIHRYQILLSSAAQKFNGQVLKNYGDGSLMTFTNSLDAVKAAKQIQEESNRNIKVPLRIGIHVGEFIVEKGDIYGNGVNLASRIESIGVEGAVLFSKSIFQKIKNRSEFKVQSLGSFEFKNVDEPIEVFALANPGFVVPKREEMKGKLQPKSGALQYKIIALAVITSFLIFSAVGYFTREDANTLISDKSIAVLPFENLSSTEENEYFSDGITEDIISRISKISDLRVISRTSVMQYKKSNKSVKQIAEELNVTTILAGSVRRSNNQVRIVAELIDANNDESLWSESYDRDLKQIFAIQSEVAHKIGKSLQAQLSPREEQLLAKQPTENLEAYTLYLKSRHHFLKYTQAGFEKGLDFAMQAIDHDTTYALAYAGLSEAYYRAASLYLPSSEALPRAKEAALTAFRLDKTLVEAIIALAVVTYRYDYDWVKAEELFKRALQLNPGDATAHEEYGSNFLMSLGRFDEAIEQLKHALNLDPYSAAINMKLQMTYYYQREYQLSLEQGNYILSIDPGYATSHLLRGIAFDELGMTEMAIASIEKSVEVGYKEDLSNAYLLICYYRSGETEKAERLLHTVRENVDAHPDMNYQLARIYSALGNKQEALYWLEKAYEMKNEFLMWLKIDPPFDSIRDEERYKDILRKLGLDR